MVLRVDEEQALATVSCRVEGSRQVVEMPIDQVYQRISSERTLILDNLNSGETLRRVYVEKDGWYFLSREGAQGPFVSRDAAAHQLCRYILSMQTRAMEAPAEPRPSPNRSSQRRRADDQQALHAAV